MQYPIPKVWQVVHSMARVVKEAMYRRVNNPTLNRNIGKYNLPHLWDGILHSIPELKISK